MCSLLVFHFAATLNDFRQVAMLEWLVLPATTEIILFQSTLRHLFLPDS